MSKIVDSAFDGCLLFRGPRRGKPHLLHVRQCDINNLSLRSRNSDGVRESIPSEKIPSRCPWIRFVFPLLLLISVGCDSLKRQSVDNPVIGAPPPRINSSERLAAGQTRIGAKTDPISEISTGNKVLPAGLNTPGFPQTGKFSGTQVVAFVNGSPILASEIVDSRSHLSYPELLDRLQDVLDQEKIKQAQYEKIRKQLLDGMKNNLEPLIERKLLVDALRDMVPSENLKKIDEDNERYFEGEIERLKKELKVQTLDDLEVKIQKQGTTLDRLRDNFASQRMAYGYLDSQAKSTPIIGRRDLYEYYQAHLEEYAVPEQARWQQIVVNFQLHGGRSGSRKILIKAVEELKNGASFSDVAMRSSDGPRAKEGGQWNWTRTGSLSDKNIEKQLFELPVGKISQIIEGKSGYHLLKVNERNSAGHRSFADIQKNIRRKLELQAKEDSMKNTIAELRKTAVIETIFDNAEVSSDGEVATQ
jgi:parvulin-like peptidyl-prolyl isomerase